MGTVDWAEGYSCQSHELPGRETWGQTGSMGMDTGTPGFGDPELPSWHSIKIS